MAKDNAALTRELAQVTADLAEISRRLNMFTPEVNDKLIAVETKATRVENKLVEIDDKLEKYLTPLVEATLPVKLASTDSKIEELVKVVQEVKASVKALGDAANAATGRLDAQATEMSPIKMSMASVEPTIRQAKEDIQKMRDEVTRNHQIGETRYAEQQGQLAVMQMQQGGGQTGSGPRSTDPLVTHKLIIGKDKITGDEEFTVIDSWIKELETDLEIILPGAKAIMVQAQKSQHIIDSPQLLSHANAALATKISRELYVIFTKKTVVNTKARFEIQNLNENQGLEALRLIRLNLCKREGQRLQDEYEVGTALPKIKESDMQNLSGLLRRWEAEINKFEAIDKGYALGVFQRRNMIYRALPETVQREVDKEVAKGQLQSYETFKEFVMNLSRSERYRRQAAPKPLTANLIQDQPGPGAGMDDQVYSVDEWTEWIQSDEGHNTMSGGYELPSTPEVHMALLAVAKGKGRWSPKGGSREPKGKGKGNDGGKAKGKGKGGKDGIRSGKGRPFLGNCHICDQPGHMARNCPNQGLRAVEESQRHGPWSSGSSNQSSSTQRVTLCVTEEVFTSYRKNLPTMSDPSWSNQSLHKSQIDQTTILSTKFPIAFGHDTVGSEIQFVGKGNQWSSVTDRTNHTDKAVWSSPQASEADTLTPDFPRAMASMSTDNMKNHSRMPKCPKKPSQRVRFTCDADDMSMTKFDKMLATGVGSPKQKSKVKKVGIPEVVNKIAMPENISVCSIPCDMQDTSAVVDPPKSQFPTRNKTSRSERAKLSLLSDFTGKNGSRLCSTSCECLEEDGEICAITEKQETLLPHEVPAKPDQTYEELCKHPDIANDPQGRPPPMHWKAMLDAEIARMEHLRNESLLPGCGSGCGQGRHCLRTCRADLSQLRYKQKDAEKNRVDEVISHTGPIDFNQSINLITAIDNSDNQVNAVSEMVWVQIPCAVDSGACAHVTPANLFAILGPGAKGVPKYFAADGSPIENMGECAINAVLEDGTEFSTSFDVAKITRPLLSVHQMVQNGHAVVIGKDRSHLQLRGGARIPLRHEGRLYMLDMWVKVPIEIAKSSPFVRQVAPQ